MTNHTNQENPLYIYALSTVAALGGLLLGFDICVISGAIPFITKYLNLSVHQEGFAVGMLQLGCIIGSSAGWFSDRFGRKKLLIISAILFTVSSILSALPESFPELLCVRFLLGLAVGSSMVSALYIAEIAPARNRGLLVSLNQFGIVIGILLTYFTNWLLVDIGENNWRWMFAVGAVPAIVFLIVLFFVPESPRWLVKKGIIDKARIILIKIGGIQYAQNEIVEIQNTIESEKESIIELFKPGLRKALLIGVLISIFAQATGIGSIIYYAPTIFLKSGYESASSALLASVLVGIINIGGTIIAFFMIDRLGRKPLLYIGLSGMTISLSATGLFYNSGSIPASWIILPMLLVIGFYAMSLGPVTWVILSEIFPTKIRGAAMTVCMIVLWISDYLIAQTFPYMLENIGNKTFYLYTVVCVLALAYTLFILKETKGKTLEEIEKMWNRR